MTEYQCVKAVKAPEKDDVHGVIEWVNALPDGTCPVFFPSSGHHHLMRPEDLILMTDEDFVIVDAPHAPRKAA